MDSGDPPRGSGGHFSQPITDKDGNPVEITGIETFKNTKLPKVQKVVPTVVPADDVEVNPPKDYSHEVSDMAISALAAVQPMTKEAGMAFRARMTTTTNDAPAEPKKPWDGREVAGVHKDSPLFGYTVVQVRPEEVEKYHLDKIRWHNEHVRYYYPEDHPEGAKPEPRPEEVWQPLAELLAKYRAHRAEHASGHLYWFTNGPEAFMQLAGRSGYAFDDGETVTFCVTQMS